MKKVLVYVCLLMIPAYLLLLMIMSPLSRLNADLVKILQWAETGLVTFNPNKTESLIYLVKQTYPYIHPFI